METSSENCNVKVAVHIRPLLDHERLHGSEECLAVVPGTPQVLVGTHSFTFDHVYGGSGPPSNNMFEECVTPLVDDLFRGYNGTVIAYGQTGSGKTYTMGTGPKESSHRGLISQVMNALFDKIETQKHQTEFQLHVSFIEILKEEVRDLLDSTSVGRSDTIDGRPGKVVPGKQPIQIRKTSDGAVTLTGSTEVSVSSLEEMAACLEQGSLNRATATTDMNSQSSRSHAIFTIILEQKDKVHRVYKGETESCLSDDITEEYKCAKLHLVDLAGSERAKRAGSNGLRLKEGIHINKGLLALGNVISALGDEKKRKEGLHVPYRDSKLTRLLQASLGGNCKTVMIACVSPADINAEETLNTLKYANRARNIQNKPLVCKDLLCNDMQKMRQQLKFLQAEVARSRDAEFVEAQDLKRRVAWLEATNTELLQKLHEYHDRCAVAGSCGTDAHESEYFVKKDVLKRGTPCIHSPEAMGEPITCEICKGTDKFIKERQHEMLQNMLDEELNELNKRLEQKQSEMKLFGSAEAEALKQLFGKKIMELEDEKRLVQQQRDSLLAEIERLEACGEPMVKMQTVNAEKLKDLEVQISDLKKKQESQLLLSKQRSQEAAKRLLDEIRSIKAQKVQLQQKIKQEEEKFRQWKVSHEKELLQLKREGRRIEYERHKLQALYQRQTMVLHRKTEEAAKATKRLKEFIEIRKSATRERDNTISNRDKRTGQSKTLKQWIGQELEKMMQVHKVRLEYEKRTRERAALEEELTFLKQVNQPSFCGPRPPAGEYKSSRRSSLSPNARVARIVSLENLLSNSSAALASLNSQLSEAEQGHGLASPGLWKMLHSLIDAKDLLQHVLNIAIDARCKLCEKEMEMKDMKLELDEFKLQRSEVQRRSSSSGKSLISLAHCADDTSGAPSTSFPEPIQLNFKSRTRKSPTTASPGHTQKMVSIGRLSMQKAAVGERWGKLSRWRRSHDRWLIQFKWKWQKPWRLSQSIKIGDEIRNSDDSLMRSRTISQALLDRLGTSDD